jgi:hypothetical protein
MLCMFEESWASVEKGTIKAVPVSAARITLVIRAICLCSHLFIRGSLGGASLIGRRNARPQLARVPVSARLATITSAFARTHGQSPPKNTPFSNSIRLAQALPVDVVSSLANRYYLQTRLLMGVLLLGDASLTMGQMCDAPNSYQFTSPRYFASAGSTNVTAFVGFSACMGRNGYVDYRTADGTGIAYQDYTPKTGTLFFSSWSSPALPVDIQITPEQSGGMPKTIRLILSTNRYDQSAVGVPVEAVLLINLPPPPNLAISASASGTVMLTWPSDGTDILLEKAATPSGTNWTAIASSSGFDGGPRIVIDEAPGSAGFYRLRRPH